MPFQTTYASPLGQLTLVSDGRSLTGLWLENQKYFAATQPDHVTVTTDLPVFHQVQDWLDRYFSGQMPNPLELSLSPIGSDFRQTVWRHLLEIPYGHLTTYGEIANKIAKEMGRASFSSQAVGGAVGHNPISILIPCHRVIGANGNLTGYAGGLTNKIKLLTLEGIELSQHHLPK